MNGKFVRLTFAVKIMFPKIKHCQLKGMLLISATVCVFFMT